MKAKRTILTVLLTVLTLFPALSQSFSDHTTFRTIPEINAPAFCIEESSDGFIWVGTNEGLYRLDGHRIKAFTSSDTDTLSLCNNTVNTLLAIRGNKILVGTNKGACIFDCETEKFTNIKALEDVHVRSFVRDGGGLWICSTSGAFHYDSLDSLTGCTPDILLEGQSANCCTILHGKVWFGSSSCVYSLDGAKITLHGDFHYNGHPNQILDIIPHPSQPDCLILASEYGLILYNIVEQNWRYLAGGTAARCLLKGSSRIIAGTDNGIMEWDRNEKLIAHYTHKSTDARSLADNVVSMIMQDRHGQYWIATDHGICISSGSDHERFVSVKDLTGSNEGQFVRVMCCDSRGSLWLGGKNGLIKCAKDGQNTWYRAEDKRPKGTISHNKVRGLHDDGASLWIVSDGGLDRYDYHTNRFTHHPIYEKSQRYNSSWMYSIQEDSRGRLWIATYEGGIFVVDKEQLIKAAGAPCCAEWHLCKAEGRLPDDIVSKINIIGDVCYAATEKGCAAISTITFASENVNLPSGIRAQCFAPWSGKVAIGTNEGIYRTTSGSEVEKVPGPHLSTWAMTSKGSKLWSISNNTISVVDLENNSWKSHRSEGFPMLSCILRGGEILAGTTDGYNIFQADDIGDNTGSSPIKLTGLFINNVEITPGSDILSKSITHTDKITLGHAQNSFSIEFSSFSFLNSTSQYTYRLSGFEDNWQMCEPGRNRAAFLNIPPGKYRFEVASMHFDGSNEGNIQSLDIRIKPVWYKSTYAYILYIVLLASMTLFLIRSIKSRRELEQARKSREEALENVRRKNQFFEQIAHEFKTPLSVMIGKIGTMKAAENDYVRSSDLDTLQHNADKIHLLIDRLVAGNEDNKGGMFIPTATSLTQFVKDIYKVFEPAFRDKGINTRFVADDIPYIFMIDRVGMESAITNLLSNALKFTPSGRSVIVKVLSAGDASSDITHADIVVQDTGIGIREEELPLIFNEYYMSASAHDINPNGSGIGLHIVKEIVERHKGHISVVSHLGEGTTFTIRLSTFKTETFSAKKSEEDISIYSLSNVWAHERKPILLLVEDNKDIRDLITATLGEDYDFVTAESGTDGLAMLAKSKIDLVITDIGLPGMSGLEMSRVIRLSLETAFLPIIILTATDDMKTKIQSYEYADAFISKPFNMSYLNRRIIQLLIKHEQYLESIRLEKYATPAAETLEDPDEVFLRKVTEYITSHLSEPEVGPSAICDVCGASQKQVYRKLKALTGMGIIEYIREIRLRKAAAYLKDSKLTISEIMYMVGFTTPSYFTKCFKARFGKTPSEYTLQTDNEKE